MATIDTSIISLSGKLVVSFCKNKFGKDKCINKNAGGLNHLDLDVCRETGKRTYLEKKGFFGWSPEKWSSEMKKQWHSNENARGFMSWDEEKIREFREEQRKKVRNLSGNL